jgi:outer membrane receptor protein involved in Fe transport
MGGYFIAQSGGAWQALEKTYYGNYLGYMEPAGSRRTPALYNLDLQLQQIIPLGKFKSTLEARIMNVFNTQTVTSYDARFDQPTFLDPIAYTAPRMFVINFSINF